MNLWKNIEQDPACPKSSRFRQILDGYCPGILSCRSWAIIPWTKMLLRYHVRKPNKTSERCSIFVWRPWDRWSLLRVTSLMFRTIVLISQLLKKHKKKSQWPAKFFYKNELIATAVVSSTRIFASVPFGPTSTTLLLVLSFFMPYSWYWVAYAVLIVHLIYQLEATQQQAR